MNLLSNEPETLASLFEAPFTYSVPPYQRAYSWEAKHIDQFLEDLHEQPPKKPYYLGHFLFDGKSETEMLVIDGQQRLSTVVLFIGAICRILMNRSRSSEVQEMSRTYIEREGRFRFLTVDDDVDLFTDLTKSGETKTNVTSRSQKRIRDAYGKLLKYLEALETDQILSLAAVVSRSHITRLVVRDKVQATQIFTLQNSRGKDLTEMEKLKAYLMYQVYLHSPDNQANHAIGSIERQFEIIYTTAERIHYLNEDAVLRHHDQAYSRHWKGPVENIKTELGEITDSPKILGYITDYCKSLASTFQNVEQLEALLSQYDVVADLVILTAPDSWPLLIKLYAVFGEKIVQEPVLIELLKNAEVTLVKFHFLHGRSSNDMVSYAKWLGSEDHTIDWLVTRMREASKTGFRTHDGFSAPFLNYLRGDFHFHRISRYILWKYENAIRHPKDNRVSPGEYLNEIDNKSMEATIEHIEARTPQTSPHSEEFVTKFLNNLGNLLFMPKGLNSSLGNRPPEEKAAYLGNVSYASHREVSDQIQTACEQAGCIEAWCDHKILARKHRIVNFAIDRWRANESAITAPN